MNARSIARLLAVLALACAGSVLWLGGSASAQDGTVVQNGNESTDSTATSAPVAAGNSTTLQSGPAAQDGASASMVGDTDTTVGQNSSASSGPASAGSQTSTPEAGSTEQNNNSSVGATAESGPVTSFNSVDAHNGPYATGEGANASMVGDGNLDISQDAIGESGPARAGSQFTASDGAIVQNTNECGNAVTDCGFAFSGAVDVLNVFGDSTDPTFPAPSGTGPVAISGSGEPVDASLIGDADAVITQSADGLSGGATLGTQDTTASDGIVQNDNTAAGGLAESGPVLAANLGIAFVGPFAHGASSAGASQVGNASGALDMDATGTSGDAVTGSQTTAATGDRAGALTVQNRSASEDDEAVTGAANAVSVVEAFAGPVALAFGAGADADASQVGDASFDIATVADAASGDAWAGVQNTDARGQAVVQNDNLSELNQALSGDSVSDNFLTSVSGPAAIAIFESASAGQVGDTDVRVDLDATSRSGDAIVGSQDTDARDSSTVQNVNTSVLDLVVSGFAGAANEAQLFAGPVAFGIFGPATADQVGDDEARLNGEATAVSGDATGGSQTTTARDSAVVQNDNDSFFNDALSGDALADNLVFGVAGPFAGATDANASQVGDNTLRLDVVAEAFSGDATAASQEADARDRSIVQDLNLVDFGSATSALACASVLCDGEITDEFGTTVLVPGGNQVEIFAGPVAAGEGDASADLVGDTDARFGQRATATSGDAAAGLQSTTASGTSEVQNFNDALAPIAGCDCPVVAGNAAQVFVGPLAFAEAGFEATAEQIGDSTLRANRAQTSEATGGSTFAGSQITDARDSTVQNDNISEDALAEAGPATAFSGLGVDPFNPGDPEVVLVVGATALALTADASATLAGDADLRLRIDVTATSGDAFAGVQETLVRGATVQEVNDHIAPIATSGEASAFALVDGVVGPRGQDASAAMIEDASASVTQVTTASSGDADAGFQQVTILGVFTTGVAGFGPLALSAGDSFGSEGVQDGLRWVTGGFVGDAVGGEAL